jgi:hypothetical protein
MKRYWIIFASLLGLVTGCAAPNQTLVPTPLPPEYLPTVIALTAEAANQAATGTAASIPTDLPTLTPAPTRTLTPAVTWTATAFPGHEVGAVQFIMPGPMSKVTSPIQFRANVIVSESEKAQVDLYGEDGRLLARELRTLPTTSTGAFFSVKIPFEIRAAAELGRITVSTVDKEGRIAALNSVHVLLLASGESEIYPAGNPAEPVAIFNPDLEAGIFGGTVKVDGDIWPVNLQPVYVELVDPSGKVLGVRILNVSNINPQLFSTSVPYKIVEPIVARLVIRQSDERIPGMFYIYTQKVLLNP